MSSFQAAWPTCQYTAGQYDQSLVVGLGLFLTAWQLCNLALWCCATSIGCCILILRWLSFWVQRALTVRAGGPRQAWTQRGDVFASLRLHVLGVEHDLLGNRPAERARM